MQTETFALPGARLTYQRSNDSAWTFFSSINWVGSRDLSDYGYGGRYNTFNDTNDDGVADPAELSNPKETNASSYVTIDLKVERELANNNKAFIGVNNLTDTNQADDGQSPLFYDEGGSYDVGHIYMPLRGRVIYGGFSCRF